jgi:hypothetical protein
MRAGDVICCSLDTQSYAREAIRLQGFCDCDAMEVSVKRSGGVEALDFLDFSAFQASFFALTLAFWASFSAFSSAFLMFLAF